MLIKNVSCLAFFSIRHLCSPIIAAAIFSLSLTFPDGVSFFSTRQRNYARDYFSASMPSPQQGSPSLVFDTFWSYWSVHHQCFVRELAPEVSRDELAEW